MESPAKIKPKDLSLLVLGAMGVVYGDLGTSPLYAMRQCFYGINRLETSEANVLGVLSLIFWALIIVISVKYMAFITRADNRGEGGILALTALALSKLDTTKARTRVAVTAMGLFGASLLYGDGMLTPAISILSAVEGMEVATSAFKPYVVPITIVILVFLFGLQRKGTARIGSMFGPVILVWFATLGLLGFLSIIQNTSVLHAINPLWAIRFFGYNGAQGFFVLGAVFLALTGGEALYADMGHFGRLPIQLGWYFIALPGLLLNYFGQGAVILKLRGATDNPFYALAPDWALLPMVVLATAATIVASQAIISGVFSLIRQAVLLGYLPRIQIKHTSSRAIGQIYVPSANRALLVATVGLVLAFKTSSGLAGAYGVAVAMTMLITTLLLYVVARYVWGWGRRTSGVLIAGFLLVDLAFCSSALVKIPNGGWFPLVIALCGYILMTTWRKGRQIIGTRLYQRVPTLEDFVNKIIPAEKNLMRAPGAAIFMSGNPSVTPPVLLHNMRYNRVVHETTAVMTVVVEDIPRVKESKRLQIDRLGHGFYRLKARYGFMESPDIKDLLTKCAAQGLELKSPITAFFLGRENIIITDNPGMAKWRQSLFALMARNAQGATPFFEIPPNQVVELGVQVQL